MRNTMRILRGTAVVLALSLMIGEIWRSYGIERPLAFVLDDQIMGVMLIASAIAVRNDSVRSRAAFAGAWGVNAGVLYTSFFGKIYDPGSAQPGNWDLGVLTLLVGLAFALSVIGLVFTLALPPASMRVSSLVNDREQRSDRE